MKNTSGINSVQTMEIQSPLFELPRKRTGRFLVWVNDKSIWTLIAAAIAMYLAVVVAISGVESIAHSFDHKMVIDEEENPAKFTDLVYFNFITALTVGYGDLSPVSYGKFLSIIEAFIGVALFGGLVAVATAKILLPPSNLIVFSKYAYYCTEPERFLIIYVNSGSRFLANCKISSYFKLGGDWGVRPSVTAPVITAAVQTFYIDEVSSDQIIQELRQGDCLRVGLAGSFGFTNFSASVQYDPESILVIPNRNELTSYEGFWRPNFSSDEFRKMFYYRPSNAVSLKEYSANKGERNA